MNKKNIEQFYDYFDSVCDLLYQEYKKPYIEGMNEAFNFLLDDKTEGSYKQEDLDKIDVLKKNILDVSFEPEEVRKSVQLGMLKGYKHSYTSNAEITPDTIGIFLGYLIKKMYIPDNLNNILDPLVGSGNLLYTVVNHLEFDVKVFGIDNDIVKCNLARNLGDLIDQENEIFYQDSLTFYQQGFDCIVTDMPLYEQGPYIPFQVINHHIDGLREGGFMFAVIENDFFEQPGSDIFKLEIDKKAHIFGLIKLSETLFKNNPKSILILHKKGPTIQKLKDFLMVELPSFTDIEGMARTVKQIDTWISLREEDIR